MKHIIILGVTLIFANLTLSAQSAHKLYRDGDQSYQNQDFSEAEIDYRKALEKAPSTEGTYNLGNAVYQQSRYEEAVKYYQEAAARATDKEAKSRAFHPYIDKITVKCSDYGPNLSHCGKC